MSTILSPMSPAMQGAHLGSLLAEMRLLAPQIALFFLEHAESLAAWEKQILLPTGIWVQKSVSLLVGGHLVLMSGLGDFRLERWQMRAVTRLFGLSAAQARHAVVNPPSFPAEQASGLAEGMVSPFFPPHVRPAFEAVILVPPPRLFPTDRVAISLALGRSVLFPAHELVSLIQAYGLRYYPQVPVIPLPATPGFAPEREGTKERCEADGSQMSMQAAMELMATGWTKQDALSSTKTEPFVRLNGNGTACVCAGTGCDESTYERKGAKIESGKILWPAGCAH